MFRIGGRAVRVRCAGGLEDTFTAPLAHLRSDPAPADLDITVFDTATSGVEPPPSPWSAADVDAAGVITTGRHHVVYQLAIGLLTVVDTATGTAACWTRRARPMPLGDRSAPFRRLFQAWFADRVGPLCHAGAVGRDGGGVLLAGPSGAGKSTTALTCLDAGLCVVGEDYCLLEPGPPPRVHSLYATGKCHWADRDRLPGLAGAEINRPEQDDKALFDLSRIRPEALVPDLPLRVIAVPRVSAEERTTVVPTSPAVALQALGATTVLLQPQQGSEVLRTLAGVVEAVDCVELRLGADPASTVAAIEELAA